MVNGKNKNGRGPLDREEAFTIYYLLFTIHQRREERHISAPLFFPTVRSFEVVISFRRGLDVNVDFLSTTAAKQPSSKCKEHYQNDDHKDHQYCDNTCAAATIV